MFGLTLIVVLSIAAIFDLISHKIRETYIFLCCKRKNYTRPVKQAKKNIFKFFAITERDLIQIY